jgi:hypothetical protein
MNKLIRQTERQVLTPLVKNTSRSMSVANDSFFFFFILCEVFHLHLIIHTFCTVSFYFTLFYIFLQLYYSNSCHRLMSFIFMYVFVTFASLYMWKRSDRCVFLSVIV